MTAARGDAPPAVLFVTDRQATLGRPLQEVVAAALRGGVARIQVRERDLTAAPLLILVRELLTLAESAGGGRARILVNDRIDVALAARAAGVHLPAAGIPVAAARKMLGPRVMLGRSTHSLAEAREAEKAGADYVLFGPVFPTASKAALGPPQGTEALRRVAEALRIPVWAIGGINRETVGELRGVPIAGVAAITAIAAAPDPAEAVQALREALVPNGGPGHPLPGR